MAKDNSSDTKRAHKNSFPLSNFTIVVIVAVLIALGLIALGLYAYNNAQEASEREATEQTAEMETVEEDEPVGDAAEELTVEEIDEEFRRLDEDLEQLNDLEDFNEEALGDDQLGL